MLMLRGKNALIFGVLNDKSIAWAMQEVKEVVSKLAVGLVHG